MQASQAGRFDKSKPLLTYSRPKGEYKDADADAIMIDFWLSNAKLEGDGGEYRGVIRLTAAPLSISPRATPLARGLDGGQAHRQTRTRRSQRHAVENGGYIRPRATSPS